MEIMTCVPTLVRKKKFGPVSKESIFLKKTTDPAILLVTFLGWWVNMTLSMAKYVTSGDIKRSRSLNHLVPTGEIVSITKRRSLSEWNHMETNQRMNLQDKKPNSSSPLKIG